MSPARRSTTRKPAAKPDTKPDRTPRTLMSAKKLQEALGKLADAIHGEFPSPHGLAILGIRTRGVILAERLRPLLEERYGDIVAIGDLDITFYRDDLSRLTPDPTVRGSEIPFDVTGAVVVLVDDVLYTGRTIRAAMDEICDFGRPALIRLAVLVDRGLREYPIAPDYAALRIDTDPAQHVRVLLEETDDEDKVVLEWRDES